MRGKLFGKHAIPVVDQMFFSLWSFVLFWHFSSTNGQASSRMAVIMTATPIAILTQRAVVLEPMLTGERATLTGPDRFLVASAAFVSLVVVAALGLTTHSSQQEIAASTILVLAALCNDLVRYIAIARKKTAVLLASDLSIAFVSVVLGGLTLLHTIRPWSFVYLWAATVASVTVAMHAAISDGKQVVCKASGSGHRLWDITRWDSLVDNIFIALLPTIGVVIVSIRFGASSASKVRGLYVHFGPIASMSVAFNLVELGGGTGKWRGWRFLVLPATACVYGSVTWAVPDALGGPVWGEAWPTISSGAIAFGVYYGLLAASNQGMYASRKVRGEHKAFVQLRFVELLVIGLAFWFWFDPANLVRSFAIVSAVQACVSSAGLFQLQSQISRRAR
jgi:hypothetical protein